MSPSPTLPPSNRGPPCAAASHRSLQLRRMTTTMLLTMQMKVRMWSMYIVSALPLNQLPPSACFSLQHTGFALPAVCSKDVKCIAMLGSAWTPHSYLIGSQSPSQPWRLARSSGHHSWQASMQAYKHTSTIFFTFLSGPGSRLPALAILTRRLLQVGVCQQIWEPQHVSEPGGPHAQA
eukprot:scaffold16203_cov17-Tisochrysis_lutea.AAC.3